MVRSCSHGSELVQGIVLKVRPFCIMVEAVLFYKKYFLAMKIKIENGPIRYIK